jgi:hypothetical protein
MTEKELEQYLISIGGIQYGCRTDIPPITNTGMFEISSGWYVIIKNLIEELLQAGWNKKLIQCKEKFGGLRFYIEGGTREIHDIIHKYEKLSMQTCDVCGDKGENIIINRWISTRCQKHR